MLNWRKLHWRRSASGFALYIGSSRTAALHVVPDAIYTGMYRIAYRGGLSSDMVNLSRATDAANGLALTAANAQGGQERRREAPPMRFSAPGALGQGCGPKRRALQ